MSRISLSVITVCWNAEKTIGRCVESVLNQNFTSYEHLIIDGLSNDGTIEIISRYPSSNLRVMSEEDKGIYDAMNKGLRMAKGEYIIFLNADDEFESSEILQEIWSTIKGNDIFLGSVNFLNQYDEVLRRWKINELIFRNRHPYYVPPHPGFVISRDFIAKNDLLFDLSYKICSDMDFMLRALNIDTARTVISSKVITSMHLGGVSTQKTTFLIRFREIFSIYYRHSGSICKSIKLIIKRYSDHYRQTRK